MPLSSREIIADPIAQVPRATVACFDPTRGELPRRALDEERTVTYLERLAALGVPGMLIASSTGQGHLRDRSELAAWLRCAARADTRESVRIALLRPEDGLAANAELLDLVASDYPVVFLRPGTGHTPETTNDAVCAELAPLIAAVAERGLAIGLYSISDVSGVALDPDAVARLVGSPGGENIVAVKVTEVDYEASTARYLAHPELTHLKIVQGWDPHLARALKEGGPRAGITSGAMAFAVHQYLHIMNAAEGGDWAEVAAAQEAVTGLFAAMQDDPAHFPDLQRAKAVMGLGHPITGTVTSAQIERIFEALEGLPRPGDRRRIAQSLDLLGDGPHHDRLAALS